MFSILVNRRLTNSYSRDIIFLQIDLFERIIIMNEHYESIVTNCIDQIRGGIKNAQELQKTTQKLIHAHIKLGNLNEAKTLMEQYFTFNRKDLLEDIALICESEQSSKFAEKLMGPVRCYAYTWLNFAVRMQQVYINEGNISAAQTLATEVENIAYASASPALKAYIASLQVMGRYNEATILKNARKEIKQVKQGKYIQGDE